VSPHDTGLLLYLLMLGARTFWREFTRARDRSLSRPTSPEPRKENSPPRSGEHQEQRQVSSVLWWWAPPSAN